MGLVAIRAWARGTRRGGSRFVNRRDGLTEMAQQWLPALKDSADVLRAHAPTARLWVVGDRECDNARFLRAAADVGLFTVRAAQDRLAQAANGRRRKLFRVASAGKLVATRAVALPATPLRRARAALLEVRVSRATLLLPLHDNAQTRVPFEVNIVELRERGNRRDLVKWTLLTNAAVETAHEVDEVVASYRARWRIEEFHRAWKAGACDLEATQLRSREAITKWATILGVVAARAERLKQLSRTTPDAAATIELSGVEIIALITAKREYKTSVESVPDGIPTIAQATRWIAELGSWTGQYRKKGGGPGTTTIARGLEHLATWTHAVSALLKPAEIKRRLR